MAKTNLRKQQSWLAAAVGVSLIFSACKSNSKGTPLEKKEAQVTTPPTSPIGTPPTSPSVSDVIGSGVPIYNARYSLSVTSLLGIEFCNGTINFKLNAAFGSEAKLFDIPAGKVACLSGLAGEFDLAEAFGALSKGTDNTAIVVKNGIMYLKGFASQVYDDPYRPFVPSFIASPKEQLARVMLEYRINARDMTSGRTDVGFVGMRTIKSGESFIARDLGYNFTDTMRFETINKGFSKLDKLNAILFDRFEFLVSFKPLAVPHIILETKVRDLVAVAGKANVAADILTLPSGAVGEVVKLVKVRIEAKLMSLEGFKP